MGYTTRFHVTQGAELYLSVFFLLLLFFNHFARNHFDVIQNYLTIDVEDYYQVSAFEPLVGLEKWGHYASRVVKNTRIILETLDRHHVKATFFVLGWTGERYPDLVREIIENGHHVACHSYQHRLIYNLSRQEFKEDTERAKGVLEQITGKPVLGYRAPSYSITRQSLWAYDILEELGFEYSSSIFPIYHDRYGIPDAPRFTYKVPGHAIMEFPSQPPVTWVEMFRFQAGAISESFLTGSQKWHCQKSTRLKTSPLSFSFILGNLIPNNPG